MNMVQRIRNHWLLSSIIILSIFLRLGAVLYLGNTVEELPGTYDQISYHNLALRVSDGHGFTFGEDWWPLTGEGESTAHWSYLYTLYLTGLYVLSGPVPMVARLIQAVIVGILQPLLAYLIGRQVFDENAGIAAAGLTAIYVYFIYYAATLMTEPFYITAIMASLYLAILLAKASPGYYRKYAFGLGLMIGIAVLLRQLYLLFVPVMLVWVIWSMWKQSGRIPAKPILITAAVIVLMIIPVTVFNFLQFNTFLLLNTNAGYAFFWANHPIYGTRFLPILPPEMGSYPDLVPPELRRLNEVELDRALLKEGLRIVIEDPVRYLRLSLSRIPVYFMFWPSADSGLVSNISRVTSFGLMWPVMLAGAIYAIFQQKLKFSQRVLHPATLLLLFVFTYSVIHILSWTLVRYRLPVDAVLLVFAGLALARVVERLRLTRRQTALSRPSGS